MAEQDNKLYITISDKRGEGGGKPVPQDDNNEVTSENTVREQEDGLLRRYIEHKMFHLAKSTATRTVNFAISNIGNFTGDYITQKDVNYAKGVVSNLTTIGITTIAGAKYGPVGAAIGFVAGTTSIISNAIFDDISNQVQISKSNYSIGQLRDRVGLNTIYDGSRGTEN